MKKKSMQKLALSKETLGRLGEQETFEEVLGGNSYGTYCCGPTLTPSCNNPTCNCTL